jgi:Spy/CpxP family protein refolding chaperone
MKFMLKIFRAGTLLGGMCLLLTLAACDDGTPEPHRLHTKHHHGKHEPPWYKVPE